MHLSAPSFRPNETNVTEYIQRNFKQQHKMNGKYWCGMIFIIILSNIISWYIGKGKGFANWKESDTIRYYEKAKLTDSSYNTRNFYFTPQKYKEGVIPNAAAAAQIAYDYLKIIDGEAFAKREQPFTIQLINNNIWHICGYLPPNALGGTVHITIEKSTGKLLEVRHDK